MSRLPLALIITQFDDLNQKLASTNTTAELIKLSKEQKKLQPQADLAKKIEVLEKSIEENYKLLQEIDKSEAEMIELTEADNTEKNEELAKLEAKLLSYLAPTDTRDDYNIILEIRGGAGGDESALFAADLLKMYSRLCEQLHFNLKVVSKSENTLGGFKEVIAEVRGEGAYSWFKYEGGVHRVQRVPSTEKQGRIHTSTVSVAIMPLIEENNEFKLDLKEVEITASTSQGAGGQSVNTTYSAIKVKHLPTGIEAQSQDERNQQQNRIRALQVLTSRVFDFYEEKKHAEEMAERREQVGRADRSEKIRTYNFPQDRVTDHRYNQSWNQLPTILEGGIFEIIEQIKKIEAERVLDELGK